jgi:CheY-like chemotaxis protein
MPTGPRVLLVDDERALRTGFASFLEACGYEVRVAGNGREAIEALRSFPADIVVTDINMPDMDGIEVISALQEAASAVPVIAISGGGLFDKSLLLDSARALGAVLTLEKPFAPSDLRDAIVSVLDSVGPVRGED